MNVPDFQTVNRAWKACSWGNTTETPEEWLATLLGSDETRRQRLFGKLFLELPDGALIRELFDEDSIRSYLTTYDRPVLSEREYGAALKSIKDDIESRKENSLAREGAIEAITKS